MPTRWHLHLAAERPSERPVPPAQLHGLAASLLEGQGSDHNAQQKPYSVSPLLASDRRPGMAVLRLGWLTDGCPLDLTALAGKRLRLGHQFFTVREVHPLHAGYGELLNSPPSTRAVIEFVSATYFSRNGVRYPLPDPRLLYGGLIRQWNHHAPHAAQIDDETAAGLFERLAISALDITSNPVDTGRSLRIGFTGTSTYTIPGADVPERILLTALTRFALASGIGALTTHGLGHVEVMISDT